MSAVLRSSSKLLPALLNSGHSQHINNDSFISSLDCNFDLYRRNSKSSHYTDMRWEQDLGDDMVILPTTEGYRRVDLKCGAEHMLVELETLADFQGVIYTRGSYGRKETPCFQDLQSGTLFNMRIPFDKCNTNKEGEKFSNTLILQHDDDLIMPGDAAFLLECDFTKPRDVPLHKTMPTQVFDVFTKISLSNADPTNREIPKDLKMFVSNRSQIVTFQPKLLRIQRDEL